MASTLLQAIGDFVGLPFLLTVSGLLLVILEAFAPGAHFIVLGVALLAAGLLGLALGSLATPLVLAGLVLVAGAVALFVYREFDFYGGKESGRTSDSDSLAGAIGRVTERVTETSGEVKLEDGGFNPYFRAHSVDGEIAEGEEVIVVDPGGGNVVTVQSLDADHRDEIDRELARERTDPGKRSDGAAGTDEAVETDTERESTG